MKKFFIFVFLSVTLSACTSTSDGRMVFGAIGSPAWHQRAPSVDIEKYWASKSLIYLRTRWDASYDSPLIREAIGQELTRRGMDSMMFWDSNADSNRRLLDEVKKAKAAAKNAADEAESATRKVEELKFKRSMDCITNGKIC